MLYQVSVEKPNGKKSVVTVDAPNQRDARSLGIEQVYADDGGVIVSHSLSQSVQLAEEAGYAATSLRAA